jgi:hypothetical protein
MFHNTGVHSHGGDANSRVGFLVVVEKLLQQIVSFWPGYSTTSAYSDQAKHGNKNLQE